MADNLARESSSMAMVGPEPSSVSISKRLTDCHKREKDPNKQNEQKIKPSTLGDMYNSTKYR